MPKVIQTKTTDIEYVYVEMVLNQDDKYEIVPGLLQGIKVKEGSTFVLLHGKKDITNITNLKFYNVMTVEVLYKDHKDMTYFTISAEDQKAALGILNNIYEELLKNNLALEKDGDLINIKGYTNVPEEYYEGTIKNIKDKSTHIQYNGVGNFANNRSFQTLNKKKELVPSIFSRAESKKPSKNSLVIMQTKIDQINLGKFEQELPETLKDVDETNLYDETDFCWAH